MERFEAKHWACDALDKTMVLLNDIVEIFGLYDADSPTNTRKFEDDIEALQTRKIGAALVDNNALRDTVGANSTLEEPTGSGRVAVLREHEIKRLSVSVDRAVQVSPFALNLDVCLIHAPGTGCRSLSGLRICSDLWRVFDDPSVQRGMVDTNTALSHDLFKITIRDAIPDIEKHRIQDHTFGVVASFEINRHGQRPTACLCCKRVAKSASKGKTAKLCDSANEGGYLNPRWFRVISR